MQRARDFRFDSRQSRRSRHNGGPKDARRIHRDLTSIVFASQRPDDETRYIVVDALPEMDDEYIDIMAYVRNPLGSGPDRQFLGIQLEDDSLTWIEISIMSPVPPEDEDVDPEEPPPDPSGFTFIRVYGTGLLSSFTVDLSAGISVHRKSGKIWVSDPGNGRVFSINPSTGQKVTVSNPPELDNPGGLECHPSNSYVYTTRNDGWEVQGAKLSGGDVIPLYGPTGTPRLDGLCFNPAATHFYTTDRDNTKLWRFRLSDGDSESWSVVAGATVRGCTTDADGNVWIASGSATSHRVYKYSATGGTLLHSLGSASATGSSADGEFNEPFDVWVDGQGRLFVAERMNHRISVFDAAGAFLTTFGAFGAAEDGGLNEPRGICGLDDMIYVYCTGTNKPWVSAWRVTA
jgi:DNA-binding beta-propeller fold protein YncE